MSEYTNEKKLHDEHMRELKEELKIKKLHDEEEATRKKVHPTPKLPSMSKILVTAILINCLILEIFVCWYIVAFSEYAASSIYAVIGLIVPIVGCVGTIVPYFQKSTAENLHKYPDVQGTQQPMDGPHEIELPEDGIQSPTVNEEQPSAQDSTQEEG